MFIIASHLSSVLASPEPYLDPGSGSILIQLLLAVILGAGIFMRTQWSKIKTLFSGKKASDEESEEDEE